MPRNRARPYVGFRIGSRSYYALLFAVSIALFGQHSTTPVLLVNGFQAACPDAGESGTFDNLPTLLQQDGAASVSFFDVCDYPGANIPTLAGLLTATLQSYPAPVDVIAHSMGGLVVRAYLQGWTTSPYLSPPINPNIQHLVLLGTPNFGVSNNFLSLASFVPWTTTQVSEMQFGSSFLWDLGTWNQLFDDLRGVDTLAIAGTAGYFADGVPWDGVVDVASASVDFADSSGLKTRTVPYCHTSIVVGITCSGEGLIASVPNRTHLSYQLLRSSLDGNDDWTSIAPTSSAASTTGGMDFVLSDSNGNPYYPNQLSSVSFGGDLLSSPAPPVWFNNGLPGGTAFNLAFDLAGQQLSIPGISVTSGGFLAVPVKYPPFMTFVTSAAAIPPGAVSVAPGSLISVYGDGLASGTAQAPSGTWAYQLAGASLTLGGISVQLDYASAPQINALVPAIAPGLYSLVLTTSQGKQSMNLMIDPSVPTFFALSGNAAAAEHATTGQVVTSSNPAVIGEYIALFGTGLGPTYSSNGLSIAQTTPAVSIGGLPAKVTFAGRAPGFLGLDQIDVQIPSGVQPGPSVSVVMSSGNRSSNTVLLAVQ
jgi:uncharacterized protein (TIGR03437 family)